MMLHYRVKLDYWSPSEGASTQTVEFQAETRELADDHARCLANSPLGRPHDTKGKAGRLERIYR